MAAAAPRCDLCGKRTGRKGRKAISIKLSARNYFEIVSSLLFFFLGLVILYRSIAETGLVLGIVMGAVFLAFGIYRLRHIGRYFSRKGENS